MNYKIEITLSDGDQVNANVEAENQAKAIERLKNTPKFVKFIGNRTITKIDIKPDKGYNNTTNPKQFVLQPGKEFGYWILADTVNQIVCKFKHGKFNETQEISLLNDVKINPSMELQFAKTLRQMSDWLAENHPEVI